MVLDPSLERIALRPAACAHPGHLGEGWRPAGFESPVAGIELQGLFLNDGGPSEVGNQDAGVFAIDKENRIRLILIDRP